MRSQAAYVRLLGRKPQGGGTAMQREADEQADGDDSGVARREEGVVQ